VSVVFSAGGRIASVEERWFLAMVAQRSPNKTAPTTTATAAAMGTIAKPSRTIMVTIHKMPGQSYKPTRVPQKTHSLEALSKAE
jgi:hypothetical protein